MQHLLNEIQVVSLLIAKYSRNQAKKTRITCNLGTDETHNSCTHQNIRRALSLRAGTGEFAHEKRNLRNSGHWLFPSSSIRFLATSAATSHTLRLKPGGWSRCTATSTCPCSCDCASGDSCTRTCCETLHPDVSHCTYLGVEVQEFCREQTSQ